MADTKDKMKNKMNDMENKAYEYKGRAEQKSKDMMKDIKDKSNAHD